MFHSPYSSTSRFTDSAADGFLGTRLRANAAVSSSTDRRGSLYSGGVLSTRPWIRPRFACRPGPLVQQRYVKQSATAAGVALDRVRAPHLPSPFAISSSVGFTRGRWGAVAGAGFRRSCLPLHLPLRRVGPRSATAATQSSSGSRRRRSNRFVLAASYLPVLSIRIYGSRESYRPRCGDTPSASVSGVVVNFAAASATVSRWWWSKIACAIIATSRRDEIVWGRRHLRRAAPHVLARLAFAAPPISGCPRAVCARLTHRRRLSALPVDTCLLDPLQLSQFTFDVGLIAIHCCNFNS